MRRVLIFFALVSTFAALIDLLNGGERSVYGYLLVVWAATVLVLTRRATLLEWVLRWFRRRAFLFWLFVLVVVVSAAGFWYAHYQPVMGRQLNGEMVAFVGASWWLLALLLGLGWTVEEQRGVGAKLARSRFTGLMLTLTTLVFLLLLIEGGLRLFMVQSDSYAFTIMHEQWAQLYWKPINELGFRDYAPDDDPAHTHILVLGDSFASGHGVNSIDDTFPHLLARELGDSYSVNIAADPGWDSDRHPPALAEYPIEPDIVILSYYYNDIGYALRRNPVQVTFPSPPVDWLEERFFIVSFLYWRVFQLGSGELGRNYTNSLVSGYDDPEIWARQERNLTQLVKWTRDRQIPFIVLLWGSLTEPESTRPATEKVESLFEAQGVPVVDMTEALAGEDPTALIVNRFDAHPNVYTHQRAADLLADVIRGIAP